MVTNKKYSVDLLVYWIKKVLYEIAKEMFFDEKALGNKRTSEKSLIRLFKSPAIVAGSLKK